MRNMAEDDSYRGIAWWHLLEDLTEVIAAGWQDNSMSFELPSFTPKCCVNQIPAISQTF